MTQVISGMLLPAAAAADWPLFARLHHRRLHRQLPERVHLSPPGRGVGRAARVPLSGLRDADRLVRQRPARLVGGARCRACGARIPARYPLVEAATGALALLALVRFGATPAAAVAFAFSAALLLITFIDLDHRFIPDEVSLPGIVVGFACAFLPGRIGPADALLGALVGGGLLWAVAWGYERSTGVEGMGYGDVKLLAMIGAFLGWQAVPAVLVVASLAGSIAGVALIAVRGGGRGGRRVVRQLGPRALIPFARRAARRTAIPFGPFLALGAMLALYRPDLTMPWHVG